jgi:hypothetical protein
VAPLLLVMVPRQCLSRAGRLETGWRFVPVPASSFGVTPYAAVQATTFHLPGYGETAIVGLSGRLTFRHARGVSVPLRLRSD